MVVFFFVFYISWILPLTCIFDFPFSSFFFLLNTSTNTHQSVNPKHFKFFQNSSKNKSKNVITDQSCTWSFVIDVCGIRVVKEKTLEPNQKKKWLRRWTCYHFLNGSIKMFWNPTFKIILLYRKSINDLITNFGFKYRGNS